MSWASRRRASYLAGLILFLAVAVGGPLLYIEIKSIPPPCAPGEMRPAGETSGPCSLLDERFLQPLSVLWSRSFKVRDGSYSALAYVENPNPSAGVAAARYRFGLYDSENNLIAEREGTMFVMPGGITPFLETGIDTGKREVVHTYFELLRQPPLIWRRMASPAAGIRIADQTTEGEAATPRIEAEATNASLDTVRDLRFVAAVFDPAGNAFAASGTALPQLDAGSVARITFTWPEAFTAPVGRVDIIPLLPPR